jgi:hypothetical protein
VEIVRVAVKAGHEGEVKTSIDRAPIKKESPKMYTLGKSERIYRSQLRKNEMGMMWGDEYTTSIERFIWLANPTPEEIDEAERTLRGLVYKIVTDRIELCNEWVEKL